METQLAGPYFTREHSAALLGGAVRPTLAFDGEPETQTGTECHTVPFRPITTVEEQRPDPSSQSPV